MYDLIYHFVLNDANTIHIVLKCNKVITKALKLRWIRVSGISLKLE